MADLINVTPELLAKLKEILATNTVRDVSTAYNAHDIPLDARSYWRVNSGAFTTIVSFLDAKTADEATRFALEDPLQPWYILPNRLPLTEVTPITHSQYVEWLRRSGGDQTT